MLNFLNNKAMKDLTWFFVCNLIVGWLLSYFVYQFGEQAHVLLILAALTIVGGVILQFKEKVRQG